MDETLVNGLNLITISQKICLQKVYWKPILVSKYHSGTFRTTKPWILDPLYGVYLSTQIIQGTKIIRDCHHKFNGPIVRTSHPYVN